MADSSPRWGVERECRKAYHRGLHRALPNRPRTTKAPAGALLRCGGAVRRDFSGISWSDPGTKFASSKLTNWSGFQERAMASHIVLISPPRGPRGRPVPAIQWGAAAAEVCAEQIAAGYFTSTAVPTAEQLAVAKGRELHA